MRHRGLQHSRLLCPPLAPGMYSNSCPLSQWCYLAVSSSATPLSFCLQSFLTSGSFPTSWLFTSGGQSIGALTSASVLPMNIQDWFPLGMTGLISLLSRGLSRVFSSTTVWKHKFFSAQLSSWSNSHICTQKNHSFDYRDLCWQVMSLLFNSLSRFVIAFLPRSMVLHTAFSWVQLSMTPWTTALQTPLSMGFPRQEYWSGYPFLSPWDLPDPGIKP